MHAGGATRRAAVAEKRAQDDMQKTKKSAERRAMHASLYAAIAAEPHPARGPSISLRYKYKYMGLLYNKTAKWPFPMPVTASTIASTASDPQVFIGVFYYYASLSLR